MTAIVDKMHEGKRESFCENIPLLPRTHAYLSETHSPALNPSQCDCIQFVGGPGDCSSRSIRCSVHFYLEPSQATFPSSEGEAGKADTEEGSQSVERQEWKHEWVPAASPDAREEGDVQVWLLKV